MIEEITEPFQVDKKFSSSNLSGATLSTKEKGAKKLLRTPHVELFEVASNNLNRFRRMCAAPRAIKDSLFSSICAKWSWWAVFCLCDHVHGSTWDASFVGENLFRWWKLLPRFKMSFEKWNFSVSGGLTSETYNTNYSLNCDPSTFRNQASFAYRTARH